MVSTTLNIDYMLFERINEISITYNIRKTVLVRNVLKYVCLNYGRCISSVGLTRYQKLKEGSYWKCFRIDFTEGECSHFFYTRFKYRISLSKLFMVGFTLYLNEVLKKLTSEKANVNYFLNSYTDILEHYKTFIIEEINFLLTTGKKT